MANKLPMPPWVEKAETKLAGQPDAILSLLCIAVGLSMLALAFGGPAWLKATVLAYLATP